MKFRSLVFMLCAAMALLGYHGLSMAQQAVTRDQAAAMVDIQNLRIEADGIAGEIVNLSPHPVRDIQLLIRHAWTWQNEFRPGTDDPGTATVHTLESEVQPGDKAVFTHRFATPIAVRSGGAFETVVSVAGFTSIIPQ